MRKKHRTPKIQRRTSNAPKISARRPENLRNRRFTLTLPGLIITRCQEMTKEPAGDKKDNAGRTA